MTTQTDKLREKWKKGELGRKEIAAWLENFQPSMSERDHLHIGSNLETLYTDIMEDRKGTHFTQAIKDGRLIDAVIRSDMVISRGWNKVAEFLYRIPPEEIREAIERGDGVGQDEVEDKEL